MNTRPEPHSTPALELRGVGKSFGRTEILHAIDLRVAAGERIALIGPNGAGKSTLFDLISGRVAPSRGEILLQGRAVGGWAPHRINRLGLARSFQIDSLFPTLSVAENLRCAVLRSLGQGYAFWRLLAGVQEATRRVDALLPRLGLAERRDTPAMHLSHADQRALELGVTVIGDARVVLLDEPTAGMNRAEAARAVALIRELTAGRTLLMVEHDMGVVFDLADRIAVLVQGELIAFDTPAAVRADARVQRAYLGELPGPARDSVAVRAC